jgi:hypothetical protein
MLDPILRAAFVDLLILVFRYVFQALGVPVDDAFLFSLAIAITGWILGNPAGSATARALVSNSSRPQ